MGGKRWLAGVGVLLLSAACEQTGANPVPLEVGDEVDGGKVTSISSGKCSLVTVSYDSEWQCSAEQIAAVRGDSGATPASSDSSAQLPETERVSLVTTDCEGLAARRRPALKAQQRLALANNRRAVLSNKCFGRTGTKYYLDGAEVSYCSPYQPSGGSNSSGNLGIGTTYPGAPQNAANPSSTTTPVPEAVDTPTDGASEYSTTNAQVVGVDEADFVKNDDGHVYVLSTRGLHVIDAWPAPETKQVKLLSLPGEPRRLYLAGNKLVVYSRMGAGTNGGVGTPSEQGCTYGYDCRFSAEPGHTLVIVFDVSDPSDPQELRRFELSGSYVDSRRVGDIVYTVVQDGDSAALPGIDLTLPADSAAEFEQLYQQRSSEADAAIDGAPAASFLPWVHRLDASNGFTDESSCDSALAAQAAQGKSFLSLVSFDLASLGQPSRTLIAGKPGYVYASEKALYIATDGVDGGDTIVHYANGQNDRSTLHKFALDGIKTSYRGSAPIAGHVLNQFSMDELNDVLRVATSSGWVPDPSVSSNLTTLSERAGRFAELAQIGGIAPTEDIRSVRFDGTRAFVVTFKKTDPLFVFDLTLPEAPKMLGELKIPGFSTYMHPLDHDHLLAIGFDADDHGSFAYFDGIQLQIFDVSDLSNPQLLHRTTVGTRGSASEALTNHLAFNYFPAKGVLALPMSICEGGDDGVYGDKLTFSGLMVFDVSLESGIKEHGRMPFVNAEQVTASWGASASCSNWWANSTSDVKRSIFMDDFAIGISDTLYQVAPLSSLSTVAQSLPLGAK
ncbi:MAG TPA: beta-propeller domain-containing protein [Polyangiaceae bacterium]|nr:beta-propeller domain-containing protein [Polyangiaceae bacterium]